MLTVIQKIYIQTNFDHRKVSNCAATNSRYWVNEYAKLFKQFEAKECASAISLNRTQTSIGSVVTIESIKMVRKNSNKCRIISVIKKKISHQPNQCPISKSLRIHQTNVGWTNAMKELSHYWPHCGALLVRDDRMSRLGRSKKKPHRSIHSRPHWRSSIHILMKLLAPEQWTECTSKRAWRIDLRHLSDRALYVFVYFWVLFVWRPAGAPQEPSILKGGLWFPIGWFLYEFPSIIENNQWRSFYVEIASLCVQCGAVYWSRLSDKPCLLWLGESWRIGNLLVVVEPIGIVRQSAMRPPFGPDYRVTLLPLHARRRSWQLQNKSKTNSALLSKYLCIMLVK